MCGKVTLFSPEPGLSPESSQEPRSALMRGAEGVNSRGPVGLKHRSARSFALYCLHTVCRKQPGWCSVCVQTDREVVPVARVLLTVGVGLATS